MVPYFRRRDTINNYIVVALLFQTTSAGYDYKYNEYPDDSDSDVFDKSLNFIWTRRILAVR